MLTEEAISHTAAFGCQGAASALDFQHQPHFELNLNRLYDGTTVLHMMGARACMHMHAYAHARVTRPAGRAARDSIQEPLPSYPRLHRTEPLGLGLVLTSDG